MFEQQKTDVVLSASFGAEVFDCESLGFGFERQDVDANGGILFFEEMDLLCFHGVFLFQSCRQQTRNW